MELTCALRRRVRYYETDRMGVVHHSNYLRLLEDARMDFLTAHNIDYCALEKRGIIIPCANAQGNFRGYLYFDDPFSVHMALVKCTGARLGFAYQVFNDNTGQLCYDGTTEHFFARDGDYFPISIKHREPELYQQFLSFLQKPDSEK